MAKEAGIEHYNTITSYVVRHSWATTMRKLGNPVSMIQEGMQHDSEEITRIYLGNFENTSVDDMNRALLDL